MLPFYVCFDEHDLAKPGQAHHLEHFQTGVLLKLCAEILCRCGSLTRLLALWVPGHMVMAPFPHIAFHRAISFEKLLSHSP